MSHFNSLNSQEWNHFMDGVIQSSPLNGESGHIESLRNRTTSSEHDIQIAGGSINESLRISNASKDTNGISQAREDDKSSRRSARSLVSQMNGFTGASSFQSLEEKEGSIERWKRLLWKTCVYLVTLGMLISLLMGLNMSWTAITAALALVVLDFKDARPSLEKVSYSLLIFFCGMFITVEGFNKTGIPSAVWNFMEPHARINSAGGIAVLALVILVLSNFASNVPTGAISITKIQDGKSWWKNFSDLQNKK